jgi:hypothetical protein
VERAPARQVTVVSNITFINGVPITTPNVTATNGVVHVLGTSAIFDDSSFNTTSIKLYLKNFADLGPASVSPVSFPDDNSTVANVGCRAPAARRRLGLPGTGARRRCV